MPINVTISSVLIVISLTVVAVQSVIIAPVRIMNQRAQMMTAWPKNTSSAASCAAPRSISTTALRRLASIRR